MPSDNTRIELGPPPGRTSLPLLFEKATDQLNICNACRYCEGFCAVFPALERRTVLSMGDVSQLANLCHDCRACYDACMYTPPHEFDINIPKVLSALRVVDYKRYVWPPKVPGFFSGWTGVFSGALLSSVLVVLVAIGNVGVGGLITQDSGPASPYALIPYPILLVLLSTPAVFSTVVIAGAARAYWREVGGAPEGISVRPVARAVWYAATLRYLRGGGADCYYPDDTKPTPSRRHLHAMVAYGFVLCFVSTTAGAILQELMHSPPPYSWLSVPVITGTIGGIGLVVGCCGLLLLKARTSQVTSFAEMTVKDYGMLVALDFLALSGLATLLTRSTPAFGIVFLIHLASVVLTFTVAPYSKFVHIVFRFLALVRDNLERDQLTRASSS